MSGQDPRGGGEVGMELENPHSQSRNIKPRNPLEPKGFYVEHQDALVKSVLALVSNS